MFFSITLEVPSTISLKNSLDLLSSLGFIPLDSFFSLFCFIFSLDLLVSVAFILVSSFPSVKILFISLVSFPKILKDFITSVLTLLSTWGLVTPKGILSEPVLDTVPRVLLFDIFAIYLPTKNIYIL